MYPKISEVFWWTFFDLSENVSDQSVQMFSEKCVVLVDGLKITAAFNSHLYFTKYEVL